jgi:hypothetical protein
MGLIPYLLNSGWMLQCRKDWRYFERASHSVRETQSNLLREMLSQNAGTDYGKAHDFQTIRTIADFQRQVPLSIYEDYESSITQIRTGKQNVLTRDPVLMLEPTSGSTSAAKLIPYTASLKSQFQRGIGAWIANLFQHRPAVRRGRAYWSISPCLASSSDTYQPESDAVPIGFDDDTAYLTRFQRTAAKHVLAAPSSLSRLDDLRLFQHQTLLRLLLAEDLSLISIWSPTFLLALLERLKVDPDQLCRTLHNGQTDRELPTSLHFSGHPKRARRIISLFEQNDSLSDIVRHLWPHLAVISCWTDAAASRPAQQLQDVFPDIEIQPKGLIATEAFVSFPIADHPGGALSLTSHFFEFEPIKNNESNAGIRLAHQLEEGEQYRVIVTTGGGLYRYQLRDEIHVVGFYNDVPLIRFCGKSDNVSDLVGEKLSEAHVRDSLNRIFSDLDMSPHFAMLAPQLTPLSHYRLYLQTELNSTNENALTEKMLNKIQKRLENELSSNPYYRQAIEFGQLHPLEIVSLNHWETDANLIYQQQCVEKGRKLGEVKPTALSDIPFTS